MTRRALQLTLVGGLTSVLIPRLETSNVSLGERFRVIAEIDFRPYAIVPEGSTGSVVHVCDESGEVEIALDQIVPGLRAWGNAFSLVPFETEAAIAALEHLPVVKLISGCNSLVPVAYSSQETRLCS